MNEIDNKNDNWTMATRSRLTGSWLHNSYGVLVNGIGWEISRDCAHESMHYTPDAGLTCAACGAESPEDFDPARPWSLWHHGEYAGNFETVEAAKLDVDTSDCGKCRDLS